MGIDDDFITTSLVLQLGFSSSSSIQKPITPSPRIPKISQPSLTLTLSGADSDDHISAGSSFSSVKRERDEAEMDRNSLLRISDEDEHGRKKLRLSKAQSALLEESFKRHSTLNPRQKQELARELKLRPRQVEVWFQNRRARTKLKQTEVDCEFLKKCCETLTDENQRLQKELHELKSIKATAPLYMRLPAATLAMCPSCERIIGGGAVPERAPKSSYNLLPHLYGQFTNQSAAC